MRNLLALSKFYDFCLALTGFTLAGGSLCLLLRMTLFALPTPAIVGTEYLSIYAKPKTQILAARRSPFRKNLDHTPVSSVRIASSIVPLTDFELLSATADVAILRTLHGRILRISPGVTLAGGGRVLSIQRISNRWVIRTTKGLIL